MSERSPESVTPAPSADETPLPDVGRQPHRVVYFEPLPGGHRYLYLRSAMASIPPNYELLVPMWADSTEANVERIPQEGRTLAEVAYRHRADSAIHAFGHTFIRKSLRRPPMRIPLTVLDLRGQVGVLNPEFPGTPTINDRARAIANYAAREVFIRRHGPKRQILYLSRLASDVGQRRKAARSTSWIPDCVHARRPHSAEVGLLPAVPGRSLLLGTLNQRKGLPAVHGALVGHGVELSQAGLRELAIIGKVDPDYEATATALILDMRRRCPSIKVTWESRQVPDSEFHALIGSAHVLLLPYVNHHGGSGLLGEVLVHGTATPVVSEFGWPAHVASRTRGITFRHGDASALAAAWCAALAEDRVDGTAISDYYLPEPDFGKKLWAHHLRLLDA